MTPSGWDGHLLKLLRSVCSQAGLQKIDPSLLDEVPLSHLVGTLGQPGLTAYVGVRLIGQPKKGEVVFVSAAAGRLIDDRDY
jgi:NADPH-dependent curcumin reductase CurA